MNLQLFLSFKSLFFLLFFVHALAASTLSFTPEEKRWIDENPVVILGADYSWAPYEFVDSTSKHSGIAADFLALVSQKSGLTFEVKPDVWSTTMEKMKAGSFDGLTCAAKTAEREKFLLC